jgi:hypothetical protein
MTYEVRNKERSPGDQLWDAQGYDRYVWDIWRDGRIVATYTHDSKGESNRLRLGFGPWIARDCPLTNDTVAPRLTEAATQWLDGLLNAGK